MLYVDMQGSSGSFGVLLLPHALVLTEIRHKVQRSKMLTYSFCKRQYLVKNAVDA